MALGRATATGDVVAGRRTLHSVVLTPAAAVATLDIRDGSGGAVLLSLQAAANGSSVIWAAGSPRGQEAGLPFGSSIHATLAGAGASVTVEHT